MKTSTKPQRRSGWLNKFCVTISKAATMRSSLWCAISVGDESELEKTHARIFRRAEAIFGEAKRGAIGAGLRSWACCRREGTRRAGYRTCASAGARHSEKRKWKVEDGKWQNGTSSILYPPSSILAGFTNEQS